MGSWPRETMSIRFIDPSQGGVEIEETAKTNPEKILKFYLQGAKTLDESRWVLVAAQLFPDTRLQKSATSPSLRGPARPVVH